MTETVFELFEAAALRVPEGGCLCAPPMTGRPYHPEGIEIGYREARERVAALSAHYRAAGYGRGHRVALLLENRPDFHLHWWALNALGCGIVPINPAYRQDEMVYLLDHSEAALVVSVPERMAGVEAAVRDLTDAVPTVDVAALPARFPAPRGGARGGGAPGIDGEAALLYTSGTTGRPKGCILTNRYFLNAARWYREAGGLMTLEDGCERLLNPLPLHHANALAIGSMAMLSAAGCIVMADRFHPRSWWADVAATRATIIHYLGIMPPLLLSLPSGPQGRAHAVRFGAGAGIDPKHHEAFEERFGFPLVEGWGMTEVAMPTWASVEPRQTDTRAFGRPLSGCEVRVVDDEDREVPPDVPGELTLRMTGDDPRTGIFSGYLKDPGGDRRGLAGRLVPHRRRGDPGCRRHALFRRPQEEHHSPQRREYRRRRGRGGAPGRWARGPGGGDRGARRAAARGGDGLHCPGTGRGCGSGRGGNAAGPLPGAARLLQGAGLSALP